MTITATDELAGGARRSSEGSRQLRNPMHEQFAQQIARLSEADALGQAGEDAYVAAGFARHRRNHVRLMKGNERVAKRIEWLRFEREAAAQAALMPPGKVIAELQARGIEGVDDFLERNAAGIVSARDLSCVPVETAIGFLKLVHRAFGIKTPIGG